MVACPDLEQRQYFSSLLGPPVPRPHAELGCLTTDKCCRSANIDSSDYKTHHTGHCDGKCEYLRPDMNELIAIIERGGIPVLYLEGSELKVVERKEGIEYTAISHV